MARIKYTGPLSTVQVQRVPVQSQMQTQSEEVSRVKLQECLAVRQQQSLEMVQIMLHVSVSSSFSQSCDKYKVLTMLLLTSSERCFTFGLQALHRNSQ